MKPFKLKLKRRMFTFKIYQIEEKRNSKSKHKQKKNRMQINNKHKYLKAF